MTTNRLAIGSFARKLSSVRLLVVDDDPAVRSALGRILGIHHRVTLAAGFAEGRERLQADTFDVVLCDVVMPDGSGVDLLEYVRAHHPELGHRFILMTGGADLTSLDAARAEFIDKPFDLRRLEDTIARVLERKA